MWCNGEIGVFIEDGNDELCPCCEGEPDEDTTDDDDEFSTCISAIFKVP